MREFFKTRRRIVGIATLVLALLAMAGWVRSLSLKDGMEFRPRHDSLYGIASLRGCVIMVVADDEDVILPETFRGSNPLRDFDTVGNVYSHHVFFDWHLRFSGIVAGQVKFLGDGSDQSIVIAPYSTLVVPLTLLSAWLLIVKPKSKQPSQSASSP